jgi:predicted dehydrogenase
MERIKIGIIGCGHWGPNHVRVFSQLRDSEVVACADVAEARLQAIHEHYPQVPLFRDASQMLREVAMDAVVVAAPTGAHYALVREALEAGKHVLCEKPLSITARESVELIALAASRQRVLMTGHVFLFNPGIVKLKELLDRREVGKVLYLRALRTNLGPIRRDVNSVFDLATHDISIFNFVLGSRLDWVSAVGGQFLRSDLADVAFVSLHYPDNILAHIIVSWLDPKKLREIVVVGDAKMVIWDEMSATGPIAIYDKGVNWQQDYADFGQFQLLVREGDITIPKVRLEEPLKVQNRFFLQCLRERSLPMNDGVFAVDVVKVLEAITRSMAQRGAAVAVEP